MTESVNITEEVEDSASAEAAEDSKPLDVLLDEQPWTPPPLPVDSFAVEDGWVNINRAPYDRVSGVVYKRAMAMKSVCHEPLDPAPDQPALWRGRGTAVVSWLLSEQPGTAEGLLGNREFRALQTLTLADGAATGERCHPREETILYVLDGCGALRHREAQGSPGVQRPLRKGDLVLISRDTRYSIAGQRHRAGQNHRAGQSHRGTEAQSTLDGREGPDSSSAASDCDDMVAGSGALCVLVLHLGIRDGGNGMVE